MDKSRQQSKVQIKMQEIISKAKERIKEDGYYKISSCNFPNWDIIQHLALLELYKSPPSDLVIDFEINHQVHDWTVSERLLEERGTKKVDKIKVLIEVSNGIVQRVFSNIDLDYIILDGAIIGSVTSPDTVSKFVYNSFNETDPDEAAIKHQLKKIGF